MSTQSSPSTAPARIAPAGPASPTAEAAGRRLDPVAMLARFAPLIFLLVLVVLLSVLEPGFRTERNLFNVMRQISFIGILAVGMTFVILTAGIDLSVGSLLAFSGIVCASAAKGSRSLLQGGAEDSGGVQVLYAALAAIGVGLLIGLFHGLLIGKLGIPAFIVTLGGLGAWRGATLVWSGGQPISSFSDDFQFWGQGFVGRIPVPVLFFLAFVVIGHVVLKYTQYGRWIYALGGNAEAARLSGLSTTALTVSVYAISGFCAGLGGFLLTSRLNSAEQVAGQNYELRAIAAVVIGGTSLFGGAGGVIGTFIGAMLIGVLDNGLVILGVSPNYQPIVVGGIIVLSVFVDQLAKQRRR
ncbi:MAG: Ribose ABC transport system, permease protein RbsC [uncultured Thermomicrobiales bacterium]|uniref:Ribose ABC transport system, permease protein RbsC n=1 Tax=uncultured Thermomicrobiales bacterium TaxID=1645740 RepID=A0A6J4UNF7_9BACT|nr:MAG: Ribose ABC transport system, permease protein RbsC [uncultured Thermomicrobiales bacterium]